MVFKMCEYGFVRTSNGYYQPIVDDIAYGDPVPSAADAVLVLSELQERRTDGE
jgi:hypothetical protein